MVSLTVTNPPDVCPEDIRKLPSQLPAKSAIEYEAALFVKIIRLEEPSSQVSVHTSTVLSEFIWHRGGVMSVFATVGTIPSEEIEKIPLKLLLSFLSEPVNFPSGLTVNISVCREATPRPVAKPLPRHVPAKSARDVPLAANGNRGNRQIRQMKMNSPCRCFERFALRIPGSPP
jgi:hypothetical protein